MLALRQYRKLRLSVLHIKLELVRGVCGIQRRGDCPCSRNRKEHDHELQAVRQYDGHRLAGLHARAREQFRDTLDLLPELRVAHIRTIRHAYRQVGRALWIQYARKCTQWSAPCVCLFLIVTGRS